MHLIKLQKILYNGFLFSRGANPMQINYSINYNTKDNIKNNIKGNFKGTVQYGGLIA